MSHSTVLPLCPPSTPPPPPHTLLFPAHTQLPKAALIRPVFVLLSETGSGGRRTEAEVTTDLRANVSEGQSALSLDGWRRPGANNKKIIKFMVVCLINQLTLVCR